LRKCSAQALRSMLCGKRNWTIAVIMGRSSLRVTSGDFSTRLLTHYGAAGNVCRALRVTGRRR
jgi:hypothetical protein